jgi:hypothetical protein
VWLLLFWGVMFPWLLLFSVLLFWDLVMCCWLVSWEFIHLKSFPCLNFCVLASVIVDEVIVSLLFTDLWYNLAQINSQIQCQTIQLCEI